MVAGFSFATTTADAKPRKRAAIERTKDRTKDRAKVTTRSRTTVARAPAAEDDSGRWRYGSSAIIVDANTGKVLFEDNPDALRHPASVTKVMTLYLLFEQLQAGRLKLDSKMEVSAKAASQSPSKLGVRAGSTIEVEDAIKALVTRSANDVAEGKGEARGGAESQLGDLMTQKARALGMSRTEFRNASGLPNPNQVTTARDLATLGRAIQDRFPKEYKYFATRTFYYRGAAIGNHNRLLGRVEGVDGIKTGYTQASGYNLLTSVKRDDRYLIGVVLGGRSGGARDARMASLISDTLPRAYAGGRTAPRVVETASIPAREPEAPHAVAPLPKPQQAMLTAADPAPAPAAGRGRQVVSAGSTDPIRPTAVRTVAIQRPQAVAATAEAAPAPAARVVTASAAAPSAPAGVLGYLDPSGTASSPAAFAASQAAEGRSRSTRGATAAKSGSGMDHAGLSPAERAAHIAAMDVEEPAPARPVRTASLTPAAPPAAAPAAARSGWQIQIGAFDAEREARAKLDQAKSKAGAVLGNATSYTEKVSKGSGALYRARFAGLDEKGAREACRLLQRNAFSCMTIRN